jgi:hypothetical protein
MTRDELIEAIIEASISDHMYLPKNEKVAKKLSNRGMLGHIVHGALRYAGGNLAAAPVMAPAGMAIGPAAGVLGVVPGVANVARYVKKVGMANRGLHQQNSTYRGGKAVKKKDGPEYD